jgi:hypothetical protein
MSRRMRWARYITRMRQNGYRLLMRKPEGKNHSEYQNVDGKIILIWILAK